MNTLYVFLMVSPYYECILQFAGSGRSYKSGLFGHLSFSLSHVHIATLFFFFHVQHIFGGLFAFSSTTSTMAAFENFCPKSTWDKSQFQVQAVLRLHGSLVTLFILVLSFVHLVLNHFSAYTVFILHGCFSKVSKNPISIRPLVPSIKKSKKLMALLLY